MVKVFRPLVVFCFIFVFGVNILSAAPQRMSRQEYIDKYARIAVQEMLDFHIPASITMAQACLESSDGNSDLTRQSNNHFGIKCKSNWNGPSVRHDDDESNECFRKYGSAEESFKDHSSFITTSNRYSFLFAIDIRDFRKWAYGLKQAGYATDPSYPVKLIKIIEDFRLYELDQLDWKYVRQPGKSTRHFTLFGFLHKKPNQNLAVASGYQPRPVEKRNRRKTIIAMDGDDYGRIAAEFGKKDWQVYQYNDAYAGDLPQAGEPVYLQAKRSKAPRGNDFHVVRDGETLWSVAQWYGVKVLSLREMNNLSEFEEVKAGAVLSLRKKK
ncbi:MAG: glucosaminidase domain-containing protein [Prolixibacteraceae bacterium]